MKFEIDLKVLPSEAPAWARHLQSDVHLMIHLQVEMHRKLSQLQLKEDSLMTSVADVKAKADSLLTKVTAETDVVNAVKAVVDHNNELIATLKQQLADAIAAGADPAQLQALSDTLDAIEAAETSNGQVVADAVAAGTPVDEGSGS